MSDAEQQAAFDVLFERGIQTVSRCGWAVGEEVTGRSVTSDSSDSERRSVSAGHSAEAS